jgi:hypothetical protein
MVSAEERLLILKMVQEKKITAEEGAQLLDALEDRRSPQAASPAPETARESGKGPRWVRVRVTDVTSGRSRINLRMPVGLVSAGLKVGTRISPEIQGLDMNELMKAINAGEMGEVIDVVDEQDGEHVEVFLE